VTLTTSGGENRDGVVQTAAKPVVSVVTVIDFAYAGSRTHDDVKATMAALAAQDFEGPFEVLLCESASHTADRHAIFTPSCRRSRYCPFPTPSPMR